MNATLTFVAVTLAMLIIGHDLYARRVPNTLLLGALAIGALTQFIALLSPVPIVPTVASALLGLVSGLVTMLPFYAIRWMGAGDVKFFATLGFLLGAKALLPIWMVGSALCGIHALVILGLRATTKWAPQVAVMADSVQRSPRYQRMLAPRQGRQGLPYAAYLGFGVIIQVMFAPLQGS